MSQFQGKHFVGVGRDDFVISGFDGLETERFIAVVSRHRGAAVPYDRIQQ